MLIRPLLKLLTVDKCRSCKDKIKLSLAVSVLLFFGTSQVGAQEAVNIADSEIATGNPFLKQELQLDRRMATYQHGQKLDVFLSLDFQDLYLNLLLGSFTKGEGQSQIAVLPAGIPQKLKFQAAKPPAKNRKINENENDEVVLIGTKENTRNLLAGKAAVKLGLIDEFDCLVEVEASGNDPQALLRRSFRLAQKGQFRAAREAAEASLAQLHPNHAAYLSALNNYFCLQALSLPDSAKPTYSQPADEETKYTPVLLLNLAVLDYQKKNRQPEEIISSLQKLPLKLPTKLALLRDLLLLKLYKSAGQQKNRETLIATMGQIYPLNPRALCALGKLTLADGHYKEAQRFFNQAQALNPRNFSIKEDLALAYEGAGDLDGAIKMATRAANDFPEIPEGHLLLGRLHLANKEFLGARLQFERLEELKPNFEIENRLFPFYIKLLDLSNKYDELIERTRAWAEKYPSAPVCHYNLAIACAKKAAVEEKPAAQEKYYRQAILAYQKALQLKPGFFNAKYNLVLILCKCGEILEARKLTEELAGQAQNPQQAKDVADLKQILVKEKR